MDNIFTNALEGDFIPEAILVSVFPKGEDERASMASFDELVRLLETAGGKVFARIIQSKESPDKATYIGSGKVEELAKLCETGGIELVVFDCELTPSQIRNLEDKLGENVRVIDRSMLILDIFAMHAITNDGKLQVELAQLKYSAPRLTGKGTSMSRLGGGIGTRGPGESKLETDRRHLKGRIAQLEYELDDLRRSREVKRKQRDRSGLMKFAIAGYTNAGKSTLLNRLTDAGILAEDKLFATLDPTTRKFTLPDGSEILLTDTVGFIRNLPHHLINAFRSTLDEVALADAVIVMIDASDPECDSQLEVTQGLLRDLDAINKPIIYVLNKIDIAGAIMLPRPDVVSSGDIVSISAKTGEGIEELTAKLEVIAHSGKTTVTFKIPNTAMASVNTLYSMATVLDIEYGEEFVTIKAIVDAKVRGMLSEFISED